MTPPNTAGLGEYTDAELIAALVDRHAPSLKKKFELAFKITQLLENQQ